MELTINNAKLSEIAKWCNEELDRDTLDEHFRGYGDFTEVTPEMIKDYLIATMESNLQYDFNFDFGVTD